MSWPNRLAMSCIVLAMGGAAAFAQSKMVSGTIVDDLGEPIAGANVVIVGTTTGVITDANGKFTLKDVPSSAKLKVSFLGYAEQVIPANQSDFNITLKEDFAELDEVVMIGYGTSKRRDLTGSVASISGDKLKANPVSNVAQALQGQLPGVSVTSQDGRPGASMNIRVRGGNSITQSNEPLYIVDGNQVSSIDDIPADNIESIDVLKDAASTAIYGARGANGVILVTTKGAKEGKCVVKYGVYYQTKKNAKELDVMNAQDYVYWNWAYATDYGYNAGYTAADYYGSGLASAIGHYMGVGSANGNHYDEYAGVESHNYVNDLMRTANTWNHDVSISGGNDRTKVYASFNYLNDEGIRIQSGFRRVSANAKLEQKINKRLKADFDIRYSETTLDGTKFDMATSAYHFRPIDNPLGDGDANTGFGNASPNIDEAYNPVSILDNYQSVTNQYRIRAKSGLTWEIVKGLSVRTELSLRRNWVKAQDWNGGADPSNTAYSVAKLTKKNGYGVRSATTLNYEVQGLGEDNNLTFLLGNEVLASKTNSSVIQGAGYPDGFSMKTAFANISMTNADLGKDLKSNTIGTPSHTVSFFGRVNYSYKGRYLATATFRADGSSNFAPENHWGYFPAAALGWRISDESWLEDTEDWLDNLKLRLSVGTSGADNIDPSLWKETWKASTATVDGKTVTTYVPGDMLGNRNLKWETTTSRNIGLDFAFINSRIRGSIEAYNNSTDDILMKVPTAQSSGYSYQMQNVAKTSNKGFEINLAYDIIRRDDWNLGVNLTYNYNKNNIDKIKTDVDASAHTGWGSSMRIPNYDYIVEEGRPVGVIQGFKADGYYTLDDFDYDGTTGTYKLKEGVPDQQLVNYSSGVSSLAASGQNAFPGAVKFKDLNNDNVVDENDVTVIAETKAKHTGGFNIFGNWKSVDFSLGFTYQIGGKVYNANAMYCMMGNKDNSLMQNRLDFVADTYKYYKVNASGDLELQRTPDELAALNKGIKYGSAFYEYGVTSSEFIEDASYLRLNTLTIGYTIPAKVSRKVGISNARIYFTGGNLFCLSGYSGLDPDVSTNEDAGGDGFPTPNYDYNSYPKARTFTFGANITF